MQTRYEFRDERRVRKLEHLEQRCNWAQNQLSNAADAYEALRDTPGTSERQLRHALQHISLAQRQLRELRNAVEQLEDLKGVLVEQTLPPGDRSYP